MLENDLLHKPEVFGGLDVAKDQNKLITRCRFDPASARERTRKGESTRGFSMDRRSRRRPATPVLEQPGPATAAAPPLNTTRGLWN